MRLYLEKYHLNSLIGWISKILASSFSLVNTRLLLDILGIDGYAAYTILNSIGSWILLLNFGIPSGIQNMIAKYTVEKVNLKEIYSNLVLLVLFIFIIFFPVLYILSIFIYEIFLDNYYHLMTPTTLFIILYLFLFFGLAQIFYKVLFAQHKSIYPNLYPAIISFFSFIILSLLKFFEINSFSIVVSLFFSSYIFIFFLSFFQSVFPYIIPISFRVSRKFITEVARNSKNFFILSVFSYLTLGIDYLVMSKLLQSLEISKYNLIMKIYNLVIMMYSTLLATSWSYISESYYKKNIKRIYKIINKNITIGILLTLISSVFIFIFRDLIFNLLSGGKIINISNITLVLASIYVITRIWTDTFALALSATSNTKIMLKIIPLQAILSITFQVFLSKLIGINGIILGFTISFLFTVSIILPLHFYKITKEEEN